MRRLVSTVGFNRIVQWGKHWFRVQKKITLLVRCKSADAILYTSTSLTSSQAFQRKYYGRYTAAVGSDGAGKRELAPGVVAAAARVIVDLEAQSRRLGELKGATKKSGGVLGGVLGDGAWDAREVVTLGDVLGGARASRLSADETVIVDLTGAGAQDAAIEAAAWERVQGAGRGGQQQQEQLQRARL